MWLVSEEYHKAIAELEDSSDRVTAIVGCALIEHALKARIKKDYGHDKSAFDNLFGTNKPLGHLSGSCQFAYVTKIISKENFGKLERVAKIRNRFAHRPQITSFEQAEINVLLDEIRYPRSFMLGPLPSGKPRPSDATGSMRLTRREKFIATLQNLLTDIGWSGDGPEPPRLLRVKNPASRGKSKKHPSR